MTGTTGTIYRLGNSSPCLADTEPNDFLHPTLVSANTTTMGTLQTPGDPEDWYQFMANAGDDILVTVHWAPTEEPNLLMMDLLDRNSTWVSGAPGTGSPKSMIYKAPYSGTYYVRLLIMSGSKIAYTLRLEVGPGGGTCADLVASSPHDQRSAATNDLGEIVWSQYDNDTGYYQIFSSTRGRLTSDLNHHESPSVNNRGDVVWTRKYIYEPEGPIYGIIDGREALLSTAPGDHPWINDDQEIVWSRRNGYLHVYSNRRGYLTTDLTDPLITGLLRSTTQATLSGRSL